MGSSSLPRSLATSLKASQSNRSSICVTKSALKSWEDWTSSQSTYCNGNAVEAESQLFEAHLTKLVVMSFIFEL